MGLQRLPLDVWQHVMGCFDAHDAIRTFHVLWDAGVFVRMTKLDAFWAVIMNARHISRPEADFEMLPDPEPYVSGVEQLVSMGVPRDKAVRVIRDAHGSWEGAMNLLGWE